MTSVGKVAGQSMFRGSVAGAGFEPAKVYTDGFTERQPPRPDLQVYNSTAKLPHNFPTAKANRSRTPHGHSGVDEPSQVCRHPRGTLHSSVYPCSRSSVWCRGCPVLQAGSMTTLTASEDRTSSNAVCQSAIGTTWLTRDESSTRPSLTSAMALSQEAGVLANPEETSSSL